MKKNFTISMIVLVACLGLCLFIPNKKANASTYDLYQINYASFSGDVYIQEMFERFIDDNDDNIYIRDDGNDNFTIMVLGEELISYWGQGVRNIDDFYSVISIVYKMDEESYIDIYYQIYFNFNVQGFIEITNFDYYIDSTGFENYFVYDDNQFLYFLTYTLELSELSYISFDIYLDTETIYSGEKSNQIIFNYGVNEVADLIIEEASNNLLNNGEIIRTYDLPFTQEQLTEYGQIKYNEGYNQGIQDGLQTEDLDQAYNNGYNEGYNTAKTLFGNVDFFTSIFNGLGAFFSIELLPNITFGMIIGIPFLISFVWFVIKNMRGGS